MGEWYWRWFREGVTHSYQGSLERFYLWMGEETKGEKSE